ncbi:hypothetical protein [Phycisphaera mikurensis]|uniref:Uncharacterized protein n=1 Tax=Phycisphaera mikurensis (strain NBRC 102666 / KCTC 22515 / FYK2301M01) TaxID=1142394 RepID=I0ICJ9_PHYMF|nr:hypothetical protein [Phycisphaera mikurensis]MBB6442136.1 hypothetical protein [Phycisphaera mikurensis]BAM02987.1 hypothetical protein PSMK_08280 [Phycisphaera mikurensis NBRC 102666]
MSEDAETSKAAPPTAPAGRLAAAGGRAVIWGGVEEQAQLAALLRRRDLLPERVSSAPAAVLAVLRGGPPPAALILVQPNALPLADEVIEVLQQQPAATRCWSFEPAPAGPGGAGLLVPIEGPLRPSPCFRIGPPPVNPGPEAGTSPAWPPTGRTRLSREELAMLLGPTKTLRTPAGDAG